MLEIVLEALSKCFRKYLSTLCTSASKIAYCLKHFYKCLCFAKSTKCQLTTCTCTYVHVPCSSSPLAVQIEKILFGNFVQAPPSYLGKTTATTKHQTLPKGVAQNLID